MIIRRLFLFLTIFFTIAACKGASHNFPAYDVPQIIIVNPDDFIRYEGLPLELTKILVSLKPEKPDRSEKVLGHTAEVKIKYHNVKVYVEYEDGWLLASGYGEWGGIIFWVDRKGDYEVIVDNDHAYPIDAVLDSNTILIAQGYQNLDEGHILEIKRSNGFF